LRIASVLAGDDFHFFNFPSAGKMSGRAAATDNGAMAPVPSMPVTRPSRPSLGHGAFPPAW
jgi:hypothetical protein